VRQHRCALKRERGKLDNLEIDFIFLDLCDQFIVRKGKILVEEEIKGLRVMKVNTVSLLLLLLWQQ